jgi:hypothetical protein
LKPDKNDTDEVSGEEDEQEKSDSEEEDDDDDKKKEDGLVHKSLDRVQIGRGRRRSPSPEAARRRLVEQPLKEASPLRAKPQDSIDVTESVDDVGPGLTVAVSQDSSMFDSRAGSVLDSRATSVFDSRAVGAVTEEDTESDDDSGLDEVEQARARAVARAKQVEDMRYYCLNLFALCDYSFCTVACFYEFCDVQAAVVQDSVSAMDSMESSLADSHATSVLDSVASSMDDDDGVRDSAVRRRADEYEVCLLDICRLCALFVRADLFIGREKVHCLAWTKTVRRAAVRRIHLMTTRADVLPPMRQKTTTAKALSLGTGAR